MPYSGPSFSTLRVSRPEPPPSRRQILWLFLRCVWAILRLPAP